MAFFSASLWSAAGCTYNNEENLYPQPPAVTDTCDTTGVVKLSVDIQPILNGSCGAQDNLCHNQLTATGVDLGKFETVHSIALNGILWSAITWDGNAVPMPLGSTSRIDTCYQAKIRKWIDEGAPNN